MPGVSLQLGDGVRDFIWLLLYFQWLDDGPLITLSGVDSWRRTSYDLIWSDERDRVGRKCGESGMDIFFGAGLGLGVWDVGSGIEGISEAAFAWCL